MFGSIVQDSSRKFSVLVSDPLQVRANGKVGAFVKDVKCNDRFKALQDNLTVAETGEFILLRMDDPETLAFGAEGRPKNYTVMYFLPLTAGMKKTLTGEDVPGELSNKCVYTTMLHGESADSLRALGKPLIAKAFDMLDLSAVDPDTDLDELLSSQVNELLSSTVFTFSFEEKKSARGEEYYVASFATRDLNKKDKAEKAMAEVAQQIRLLHADGFNHPMVEIGRRKVAEMGYSILPQGLPSAPASPGMLNGQPALPVG